MRSNGSGLSLLAMILVIAIAICGIGAPFAFGFGAGPLGADVESVNPQIAHVVVDGPRTILCFDGGFVRSMSTTQFVDEAADYLALVGAEVEYEVRAVWTDAAGVQHEVKTLLYKNDSAGERLAKMNVHKWLVEFQQKAYPPVSPTGKSTGAG